MKLGHEARKQREEIAKREEGIAAREAKLKDWEAREADKKRNPAKYLAQDYGADWYDKLSQVKLSGGSTPDLIASEVDDRVASLEKKLAAQAEDFERKLTDRDSRAAEQTRADYEAGAIHHVKSNPDKYPLVHAFEVVGNIPAVIRSHFDATCSMDEKGRPVAGEVWTAEQAALEMEKALSLRVAAATKANAPPAAKPNIAVDAQRTSPTQRRTLSTELTGSSTGKADAAQNEAERKARATAAWDRVVAARQAAH